MEMKKAHLNKVKGEKKFIKCVAWDLDNTLWNGVLLENDSISLRENVPEIIKTLDSRGILQSIASKNEYNKAMAKLQEFGLQEYFLYPQINWNSKSSSIKTIAESINIGLDTIAFIDDQPFELEEVKYSLPTVLCIDTGDLDRLLEMPEMRPRFINEDSRMRRLMYISDIERKRVEEEFLGPKEEFLATLNMVFTLSPAGEQDLMRAEELTIRTNQLNTTGYTYSYDELDYYRQSNQYKLWVASLDDRFGSNGKIGLFLVECKEDVWTIKLLLMSCRVMSRGVGTILISHILNLAKKESVKLMAEFVPNDQNRMMYMTYKFSGFKELEKIGNTIIFENDMTRIQPFPEYVKVKITD